MRTFLAGTAASLLLASMVVSGQTEQSVPILENESSGAWFVELASPPGVDGTATATLEREEASFHAAAAGAGVRYTRGRSFRSLWNGVTVRASAGDVTKLRSLPGVDAVYPVVKISVQQAEAPPGDVADLVTAIAMTGADIAQSELGLSGRGVKVAVIDTRHRLRPPGPRRLLRTRLPRREGLRLRRRRLQRRPVDPAYNPCRA